MTMITDVMMSAGDFMGEQCSRSMKTWSTHHRSHKDDFDSTRDITLSFIT